MTLFNVAIAIEVRKPKNGSKKKALETEQNQFLMLMKIILDFDENSEFV